MMMAKNKLKMCPFCGNENIAVYTSGKFYAVHMGHCVDETRLPYAAQRHTIGDAHKLGAVIVRDGFMWLLSEHVDWKRLKNC